MPQISRTFAQAKPWTHPRPYIFALGRLVPQKGFDLLIEAFADAALPAHDLLIAGEGPERAADWSGSSKAAALAGRVHLLGRAERPKVASLFLGCSFFALPSRADEGLPVVCAEAMAAGKAVVAARAGGTPEAVIDGESGIIFEKEDRPALAAGAAAAGGRPRAPRTIRHGWRAAGSAVFLAEHHRTIHGRLPRRGSRLREPSPLLTLANA